MPIPYFRDAKTLDRSEIVIADYGTTCPAQCSAYGRNERDPAAIPPGPSAAREALIKAAPCKELIAVPEAAVPSKPNAPKAEAIPGAAKKAIGQIIAALAISPWQKAELSGPC